MNEFVNDLIEKEFDKLEDKGINHYLMEWDSLVEELSEKEVALFQWKEVYNVRAQEIEAHTDFKELYGKNNADVRKNHIRNELVDWYDIIKDLEISINWITRRISFLRELVKCKRTLLEVKTR